MKLPSVSTIRIALALGGLTTPFIVESGARGDERSTVFEVVADRGEDVGQSFGALFEGVSEDGTLQIGAGFTNTYNTRYRADRHALQFYVRSTDGAVDASLETLPRPSDMLTGAYLYTRDGVLYSTYGGLKSWDVDAGRWRAEPDRGGTGESMRLGDRTLVFADSRVLLDDREVLAPPDVGSYQLFYYADGWLCFYHVHRNDRPYRPYKNDEDGFSRLYACRWKPADGAVDLGEAITLRLPVVGETTFAWGQLGSQIVTGSNIGGFYVFDGNSWKMELAPTLNKSYQLYTSLQFYDRLLLGQYPTGRVFTYDGDEIRDQPGWPPVMEGVSASAREAQTMALYGGELFVGVWPWGELWRYHLASDRWRFQQRMFSHPEPSQAILHPYDEENQGNSPGNLWGQRVTSLAPLGEDLYIATSAKAPLPWAPDRYPFLAPDRWKSYGQVYRLTIPGRLTAATRWTAGPTTFRLTLTPDRLTIDQDGQRIGTARITGRLSERLQRSGAFKAPRWGEGVYGPFRGKVLRARHGQPSPRP